MLATVRARDITRIRGRLAGASLAIAFLGFVAVGLSRKRSPHGFVEILHDVVDLFGHASSYSFNVGIIISSFPFFYEAMS
ncbi:hypothetical protein [Paraburkholderia fynbosensis]|uniref:hypothetical protein n=1 Tax=Paraburkholderia fynbosensis TaxID=1200993 RepID=UPI00158201EA|nr:hypothetical protein [Paraburkholderia fynbosensis]